MKFPTFTQQTKIKSDLEIRLNRGVKQKIKLNFCNFIFIKI